MHSVQLLRCNKRLFVTHTQLSVAVGMMERIASITHANTCCCNTAWHPIGRVTMVGATGTVPPRQLPLSGPR